MEFRGAVWYIGFRKTIWMEVFEMTIKTPRLVLRPLCLSDLKTTHEYASDLENTKYMLFLPNEAEQETADFLRTAEREWQKARPSYYEFAIVLDGAHIGAVSVSLLETSNQGEIGWIINKKYWNRGYASEAAGAVLDFAKTQLRLQSVIAQCDWRNVASARVMEKIGMGLVDRNGMRTYVKREETARELTYMIEF